MKVLVVDDHPLMRASLAKLVDEATDHEAVGTAGSLLEARRLIERTAPDLLLLDLSLGEESGLELVRELLADPEHPHVVLVSMHVDDAHLRDAIEAGVDAYVSKAASPDEILAAIEAVSLGGSYLSPDVAHRLLTMRSRHQQEPSDLTSRELEILRLLAVGGRVGDIAESLVISPKTVKNHLTSVYAKLGVETGAQAVAEAYRRRLVTLPPSEH